MEQLTEQQRRASAEEEGYNRGWIVGTVHVDQLIAEMRRDDVCDGNVCLPMWDKKTLDELQKRINASRKRYA